MNRKTQYFIWTSIAGAIFLIVGIHDVFFPDDPAKSRLVIGGEFVAGLGFLLSALRYWLKSR